MDFFSAVKSVYSKYATFSGRAGRAEYWYFFLFTIVAGAVLSTVAPEFGSAFSIANFIPNLAVAVRRLHDTNRSGKLLILLLVVEVVLVVLLFVVLGAAIIGASTGNDNLAGNGGIGLLLGAVGILVVGIYWIYLMAKRGDTGANKYGSPS